MISNTLASEMLSDMIDLSGDDGASERSRQIASANARIADFRRAGQWERVVDESTALIKICPRNSSAYCARGAAYGKLGFFSDSVSDFSQAIRCDPTSYLSFFNRAMAYTRISRYAEAVADLKRVLEIEPTYARAQQLPREHAVAVAVARVGRRHGGPERARRARRPRHRRGRVRHLAARAALRRGGPRRRVAQTARRVARVAQGRELETVQSDGGLDSLDSMLDNNHVLTSSSRDWSLDVPAGWFS